MLFRSALEDISNNIDEVANDTRRIDHLVKTKNTCMVPSQLRRAAVIKSNKQTVTRLKESLHVTNFDIKYKAASKAFTKLILLDREFGSLLKDIKEIYEEKIRRTEDTSLVKDANKSIKESKSNELIDLFQKKNELINYPLQYKSKCENVTRKKSNSIVVPKLNLSKVRSNFPNDKVVFIKAKTQLKYTDSIYDNSEEADICDEIY